MLLAILGAGASYDSLEPLRHVDHAERPPLAAHLFDDREFFRSVAIRYPEAFRLFPMLRHEGALGGIEAAFDRLQSEVAEHPSRIRQLAALRFYIRDAIADVTARWISGERVAQLNHHALLEQLDFGRRSDRVLVATFNYDTFIETALGWFGFPIDAFSSYIQGTSFPLFKLHGSIDWSREENIRGAIDLRDTRGGALEAAGLIKYAGEWVETDSFVKGQTTFVEGRHYVPAIAVPVQSKTAFQCPPSHLTALTEELPNVSHILTIGWRAQEHHFLALLAEQISTPVSVFCVSGDQTRSEDTVSRIRRARLLIESAHSADMGFSELVSTRAAQDFMKV